jgi:hypothetical protein
MDVFYPEFIFEHQNQNKKGLKKKTEEKITIMLGTEANHFFSAHDFK